MGKSRTHVAGRQRHLCVVYSERLRGSGVCANVTQVRKFMLECLDRVCCLLKKRPTSVPLWRFAYANSRWRAGSTKLR